MGGAEERRNKEKGLKSRRLSKRIESRGQKGMSPGSFPDARRGRARILREGGSSADKKKKGARGGSEEITRQKKKVRPIKSFRARTQKTQGKPRNGKSDGEPEERTQDVKESLGRAEISRRKGKGGS